MIARFLAWLTLYLPMNQIRREGKPYMNRFFLLGKDGKNSAWGFLKYSPINLFLHHLLASDGPEHHNHPWGASVSLILAGGYTEQRAHGYWRHVKTRRRVRPGRINLIRANDYHRLELRPGETSWSLFAAGPKVQSWGFVDEGGGYRNASGIRYGRG